MKTRVQQGHVRDREFDVLCFAADRDTASVEQLAEHICECIAEAEGGCHMEHHKLRRMAERAATRLVRLGHLSEVIAGVWEITDAGRAWLASEEQEVRA